MRPLLPKPSNRFFEVLAFLLLCHLIFSTAIVFSPTVREFLERTTLTQYYRDYAVIGPFFTSNSVRTSHEIALSFKRCEWSNWVFPVKQNHDSYLNRINYSSLKRARFENFLAGRLYMKLPLEFARDRTYVRDYFLKRYPLQDADSIRMLVLKDSVSQSLLGRDTIKIVKYSVH